jgi:hypothetical protein
MTHAIHYRLAAAIASNLWHDPGPSELRRLFHRVADLPNLKLYTTVSTMESARSQLDDAGYVDDPEFCLARNAAALSGPGDSRLSFEDTVFLGGAVAPGDDVLIALDAREDVDDPYVFVFDWSKSLPHRWVQVGSLSYLIDALQANRV